jgi:ABC-type nitrate/sulfonate/bicarbonate transport system ATPase subunit
MVMSSPSILPLVVRDVSKFFRVDGHVVQALQDVSLDAQAHEFISLIGPSGCGKSTLLNIIGGLLEPDQGGILLGGAPGVGRLGRIGYMPQRDLLLPWRKLLDNVLLGPEVCGQNMVLARREAQDLLPLFGLQGFEDHYPTTLSGGMRQRAALMRTFMCKQEILLLDEPFGALDALTRRIMRRWLQDVWSRFRQTLILVTHDVEEAVFLSNRVYVFSPRPGRVLLELDIDLPQPRSEHLVSDPRFIAYRDQLLETLGV